MNREQAKKWLPIIEAYANGETIQYRFDKNDEWYDCLDHGTNTNLSFTNPIHDYRIKPKPREFWVVSEGCDLDKSVHCAYASKEHALTGYKDSELILVREVID